MAWLPNVTKGDYAINGGDVVIGTPDSPQTLGEGDDPAYPWVDTTHATGVGYLRSEVRIADITDGTSNTYLVGEKLVSRIGYSSSDDPGHDQCFFCGVDWDNTRWSVDPPLADNDSPDPERFGSAHASVFHVVMCDGSVRAVSFQIDRIVHRNHGNRRDGASSQ